jgi:hypothetical protein
VETQKIRTEERLQKFVKLFHDSAHFITKSNLESELEKVFGDLSIRRDSDPILLANTDQHTRTRYVTQEREEYLKNLMSLDIKNPNAPLELLREQDVESLTTLDEDDAQTIKEYREMQAKLLQEK